PQPVPLHRLIVVLDIEGSTTRTNSARGRLRRMMYTLFEEALRQCGISEDRHDPVIDRGDGALLLIHPVDQVPKTLLLGTFIPMLSELVAEHNEARQGYPFRLRAALHAGEI